MVVTGHWRGEAEQFQAIIEDSSYISSLVTYYLLQISPFLSPETISARPQAVLMARSGCLLLPTLAGFLARAASQGHVCYWPAGTLLPGRGPGCRARYKRNYSLSGCVFLYASCQAKQSLRAAVTTCAQAWRRGDLQAASHGEAAHLLCSPARWLGRRCEGCRCPRR